MAEQAFYRMTAKETLEALESGEKGLTRGRPGKRREKYGPNDITTDVSTPKWLLFLSQLKDLLVLVLIFAGLISFAIGSLRDGTVMFVIVLLNATIGFVQEYKAGKILEKLKDLYQVTRKGRLDGELAEVPQSDLVPGDIVQIDAGTRSRRISGYGGLQPPRKRVLAYRGIHIAGEKSNVIDEDVILADRENMLYMGTSVATGSAVGVVVRTGMNTEMGKIATMTQDTVAVRSPLQVELGVLAKWLTVIVAFISAGLFAVALWQGSVFHEHGLCPWCGGRRSAPGPSGTGYGSAVRYQQGGWPTARPLSRICPPWRPWGQRRSSVQTRPERLRKTK